jgi:hypothetical protein
MARGTIRLIETKKKMELVTKEFNKKTGVYEIVWRKGGSVTKRESFPLRTQWTLDNFRSALRLIKA